MLDDRHFPALAVATNKVLGSAPALPSVLSAIRLTRQGNCTLVSAIRSRTDRFRRHRVGWNKEEVEACGYRWDDRGARCDEFLEVMRGDDRAGRRLQGQAGLPVNLPARPRSRSRTCMVPIIVGGYAEPAIRRAVRFGAGWYGFNRDVAATKEMVARLDAALAKQAASAARTSRSSSRL